jgi:hypothetical protein
MNDSLLHKRLTAAARLQTPDDRVPYAFEKRIVALVEARKANDRWAPWAHGLWRAAATCIVVTLLAGMVSYVMLPTATIDSGDLAQEFENTLLASADQPDVSLMP